MSLNIKPLADRVVIRPAEAESKTAGGIIIPDNAQERPLKGEVVAVGKGTKDEPMTVEVGDTVLYGKFNGIQIEVGDEKDLLMMKESDLLAIIK